MTEKIHRTALDLPPEEWKKYQPLQAILQRQSATHSQLERRRKRAIRIARQAASFNAKKVVLFGSLAIPENFTFWSDIDLAVFGVPADRFYAAVAAITGLSAEFKIDLVDGETCKVSLRDAFDRDGIELDPATTRLQRVLEIVDLE